jgi:hypothetical protein
MHKLIYPFGKGLCTKCGLPAEDENETCLFGFLADDFTGEPRERHRRDRDKRDDRVFVKV